MFFYTSLFIASLLVALVVHWLYRVITDAVRALSKTRLSTVKSSPAGRQKHEHGKQTQTSGDSVPWGWPGNEHDIQVREEGQLYDLSTGVLLSEQAPEQKKEPAESWSAFLDKPEFVAKPRKKASKEAAGKTNIGTISKPWGW